MRLTTPKCLTIPVHQKDIMWEGAVYDQPRVNRVYLIKHSSGAIPFYAYQDFDFTWYEVIVQDNGNKELGKKLKSEINIFYARNINE